VVPGREHLLCLDPESHRDTVAFAVGRAAYSFLTLANVFRVLHMSLAGHMLHIRSEAAVLCTEEEWETVKDRL
jgi:hypothetical protein